MSGYTDSAKFNSGASYYVEASPLNGGETVAGNLTVSGSLTTGQQIVSGGNVTATGNVIANLGVGQSIDLNLAGGAGNPTILMNDNGATSGIYFDGAANSLVLGIGANPNVVALQNFSSVALGGTWAGTTVPTLPYGGIPINTISQAGNIKIGNTRIQFGIARMVFTAGSSAIVLTTASPYTTVNTCCFLTGGFGNAGNLPVTLQVTPGTVSTFSVNAAIAGVGYTGSYEFQWLTLGPA